MQCQQCQKKKLTSEYPSRTLSTDCQHHCLLVCLRCCVEKSSEGATCPAAGCGAQVDAVSFLECRARFRRLTFDYEDQQKQQLQLQPKIADAGGNLKLTLTTLLGDSQEVEISGSQKVDELKRLAAQLWQRQRQGELKLLHAGSLLQDGRRLSDCRLGNGDRLQLLFVLQELTPNLERVRVQISWGWPGGRDAGDYLDTSCFTFSRDAGTGEATFLHTIDCRTRMRIGKFQIGQAIRAVYESVVEHDGAAVKRKETQTSSSSFTVWPQRLQELRAPAGRPTDLIDSRRRHRLPLLPVTHLFFVVFTFKKDSCVGSFRQPELSVFDSAGDSSQALCSTRLHSRSKGLIACMLTRAGCHGNWAITDVGRPLAEGSIKEPEPVRQICRSIIEEQLCS